MPTYGQFQKKPASQSAPTSFFTPQLFQSRPFREPTIAPPPEASIQTRSNDERDSNGNPTWWSRLQFSSSTAVQPKLNIRASKDQQEQESEVSTETLGDRTTAPATNMPPATIQASGYGEGAKAELSTLHILIRNLNAKQATASARPVQPKLTIGQPNDQYEQEADRVANQVMSMGDRPTQPPIQRETAPEEEELQTKPLAASITPLIQRESMPEEEELQTKALENSDIQREDNLEEEELQTKPGEPASIQREDNLEEEELQTKPVAGTVQREEMPEEEEALQTKALGNGWLQREEMPEEEEVQTKPLANPLQRQEMPEEEAVQTKPSLQRATDGSLQAGGNLESRLNSSKGGGSPLPQDVKGFMESRFRTDFSQVRAHTDNEAVQMNRDLNAQAFTHKQDVYFSAGKTPGKDALTAHELTHVVQQASGIQTKLLPNLQKKCSACEAEDKNIQRTLDSSSHTNSEGDEQQTMEDKQGLASDRFKGDPILEACYADKARLTKGAKGESVVKIQQALIDLGYNLGATGADSNYGTKTWDTVKQFKADQHLGWEQMGDVGPGTMHRLDELFPPTTPPSPPVPLPPCPLNMKHDVVATNVAINSNKIFIPGKTCTPNPPIKPSICDCSIPEKDKKKDREIHLNIGLKAVKVFQRKGSENEFGKLILGPSTKTKVRCSMYSVQGHQKVSAKGLINFVNYDGNFGFHSNFWKKEREVKTKDGKTKDGKTEKVKVKVIERIPGAESHGCARLHDPNEKSTDSGDSIQFFNLVKDGDCVRVYDGSAWENPAFGDCETSCHEGKR
jgi:peptidoglycan hydrolase-like protein with peptidoglycan-binding domain